MKKLLNIILIFLNMMFLPKIYCQANHIDITSKSEEGFRDFIFNVTEKHLTINNEWEIILKGRYNTLAVGIKIIIKNGMKAGIVNGKPDKLGMTIKGGEMVSIGKESDNFIRVASKLYGFESSKKFSENKIVFDCFSLNSSDANLDSGEFKFKIFFDSQNKDDNYSEMFLNLNINSGFAELNEKDPEYRNNIITQLTK